MTASVPYRPFASDPISGLMLPDGIFVTMLGRQMVNLQVENDGSTDIDMPRVYFESASTTGITVAAGTRYLTSLRTGGTHTFQWEADFTSCPAGTHFLSFILEDAAGTKTRFIKKVFVLGVTFDAATETFHAEMPEGVLSARFVDLVRPRGGCGDRSRHDCCCPPGRKEGPKEDRIRDASDDKELKGLTRLSHNINQFASLFSGHDPAFTFCPPGYLPHRVEMRWTPTPAYEGQYSDLPFQDPWHKVILCILAFLLLIGAAIAEAVDGSGTITTGGGTTDTGGPVDDCCGIRAGGGGTSYVAAGLVAAAAAAATAAALSDARDPIRRGEDATDPGEGELTLFETLKCEITYPEPVALGKPFTANARWQYRRETADNVYDHGANDSTKNIHVATSYEVNAPEVAYSYKEKGQWVVTARFEDADGKRFAGNDLFVQCFLTGPNGEWIRIAMNDDGLDRDDKPGDGVYSGRHYFRGDDAGLWRYFVIAQDVNQATPNMTPEEAAQIIGGMVVTHQLTISFGDDECAFVPDGHVNVV